MSDETVVNGQNTISRGADRAGAAPIGNVLHLLDQASDSAWVERFAGGKAKNLHKLSQPSNADGAPYVVPQWSALGTDVFHEALHELLHGVGAAASARATLGGLTSGSTTDEIETAAAAALAIITGTTTSSVVLGLIDEAYRRAGGGVVAVRSSAAQEDGGELSYAGQFDTVLGVSGIHSVRDAVRACWASAFSPRSLRYRLQHGAPVADAAMGVVIQQLVPSEISGVLFTSNPVTGSADTFVLSAVYGLGEGLVSGHVDADTLTLDAATGAVVDLVVGDKGERFDVASGGAGVAITEVPAALRGTPALSETQVALLHQAGDAIAAFYGAPQDIEWAITGDTLFLLQSRPITAAGNTELRTATPARTAAPTPKPAVGHPGAALDPTLQLWDNSNLIESFNGITSPLTYTVAREIYFRAYRGYAISLGVKAPQLAQIDGWMPDMLGNFHGRIYYQLLHRYRMARLAPMYRLTRRVLEVALGVSEPMPDEVLDTLHPFTFRTKLGGALGNLRRGAIFTKRYLTNAREIRAFTAMFYRTYDTFDGIEYESMTAEEVFTAFRRMEDELVDKWGSTMIGDDSLLITFGAVHLMTARWLPDAPQWLIYATLAPGADVESAGPAEAIASLAAHVRENDDLRTLITTTAPRDAYARLQSGEHQVFFAMFNDYVKDYGYRSTDELKLEVPDLREDPTVLLPMLRNALNTPPIRTGNDPDAYLDAHLRGPRRWVYEMVRRKGSTLVASRERLRFARTRAFGLAKRMCRAMGRDLAAHGVLEQWDDIFFLEFDELRAFFDGTLSAAELPALVRQRRVFTDDDRKLIAPPRFETFGDPTTFDLRSAGWRHVDDIDPHAEQITEMRGTPSSPGVVEGIAVVAEDPGDSNGGILIAYRTDPGWIAALASASALLVERGSPLTHVSVVARELGIPTIVQLPGITEKIRTGAKLRIDGATGVIEVLEHARAETRAA